MRKICIANQKGGVAKTTTAVNLAAGLAMQGKKTLLIDMDPQANATFATLGGQQVERSTYDVLIHNMPLADVILPTGQAGMDILPSNIDLAGAEVELISKVGGQTRLRTKLAQLAANDYKYVIIDAPPSLGFLTINALAAADEVFIPVSASVFALNGIAMLEETIQQIRTELGNSALHIGGVLCTFYDHTNVAKDVLQELQTHFQDTVFQSVIPKNVKIEEAHSRTQSIFAYAADSSGAQAYGQFIKEVLRHE